MGLYVSKDEGSALEETLATRIRCGVPLSFATLLKESFRLYGKHWRPFTLALLGPVLKIVGGSCLAVIASNVFVTMAPLSLIQNRPLFFSLLSGICLLALLPFFQGFWEYLVFMVSLNCNAWEMIQGQPTDFKATAKRIAKQKGPLYQAFLGVYWFFPIIVVSPLFFLCVLLMGVAGPEKNVLLGVWLLLAGLLYVVISLLVSFLLLLSFQEIAFATQPMTLWHVCLRSMRMVFQRFWTILGFQLILAILIPGILIPLGTSILRLLYLTRPLDRLTELLLYSLVLRNADALSAESLKASLETMLSMPLPPDMFKTDPFLLLHNQVQSFAAGITDTVVQMVMVFLILPLSIFMYTLLYQTIRVSNGEEPTPSTTDEIEA